MHHTIFISRIFCPVVLILFSAFTQTATAQHKLRVSENKRYLVRENGKPFFYLGDTAWELFHRLNRPEADLYLTDRAKKGYTVIQAVVLAELNGLDDPNPYGHVPLKNRDPQQPNEAYFKHVDYIVNKAESLGMYIGMLPTWGDKWNDMGKGREIFTPENARVYGEFIGKRYRNKPIIWILGGDRNPETDAHRAIIRAMAEGIRKGDGGQHLITFHPRGNAKSSTFFHEEPWLDFNMFQSGHGGPDYPNYEYAEHDYKLTPTKPTLDGEPRYEDITVAFNVDNGRHETIDVRQAAYWSVLAGSLGHTYGNNNIWQMWQPGRDPIIWARIPWNEAIHQQGATQMGYVRKLAESRPYLRLLPDQSLLILPFGEKRGLIRAARDSEGSFIFVYSTFGEPFRVKTDALAGEQVNAWWFNPREGTARQLGTFAKTEKELVFMPPSKGRSNDWVLVLDNAAAGYQAPGSYAFYGN
jgi:hypothetical protein